MEITFQHTRTVTAKVNKELSDDDGKHVEFYVNGILVDTMHEPASLETIIEWWKNNA